MTHEKAREDLEYIRRIIGESRTVLVENGDFLILWGVIVSIGTVLSWIFAGLGRVSAIWILWISASGLGTALTLFIIARKYRRMTAAPLFARVYGVAWGGCAAAAVVISASLSIARGFDLGVVLSVISGLIGTAYLIMGSATRYWPISLLSLGWWGGSAALVFLPQNLCSALMGCMAFAFELVPGIILRVISRKNKEDEGL